MKRGISILLVLLAACSQFHVRSNFDPGTDFARFRTYAWLPIELADPADQRLLDRYLDKRLRSAVQTELGAKGYAPAGPDAPDFFLNYRLATESATAMRDHPRLPYSPVWGGWGGAEAAYVESYDAGTLYIAVIDGRSRHLVWLGSAQARLLSHAALEKKAQRVDDAAHQILASFPSKAAATGSAP